MERENQRRKHFTAQQRWMETTDQLLERLNSLEDELSFEEAERVADEINGLLNKRIRYYRGIRERKIIDYIVPALEALFQRLEVGTIYQTRALADMIGVPLDIRIGSYIQRINKSRGVAEIMLWPLYYGNRAFHHYWMRPEFSSEGEIPQPPEAPDSEKRYWSLIYRSIKELGYCESPENLDSHRTSLHELTGYAEVQEYAENGQPTFKEFVERSGLPVGTLKGKTAIVYDPDTLRTLQELAPV